MNKKLLNQIKNEWRSNVWIVAELLLVSVVMWFIIDFIYVKSSVYTQPLGFDISHCYQLSMETLVPTDPDYVSADTLQMNDVEELMERLRRRPEIEAVGLSKASYPYDGSNRGGPIEYKKMKNEGVLARQATPDFIRVFRYRGERGESSEELSKKLGDKGFIASNDIFKDKYKIDLTSLLGKPFIIMGDSSTRYKLLAVYAPVRYTEYKEALSSCSLLVKLPRESYSIEDELCIRVKADKDKDFKEKLWKDVDKQLRVGNIYVSNIESFNDIRENYLLINTNQVRNYLFGMGFLMLNIFLGLLGTFWFRAQQRRGEIALLKALGANKKQIFGRQISEGLLLLTIATIPAVLIDFNIALAGLNQKMNDITFTVERFTITIFVTWMIIAVMIVLGCWLPAKKAMRIEPAKALHEE